MTNTCKTCRWWDEEPDDVRDTCDLQLRMCLHMAVTDEIKNHHVNRHDLLYSIGAPLTGPDFGCIHHQLKDDNNDT